MSAFLRGAWRALLLLAVLHSLANGAFINFENCLPESTIEPLGDGSRLLQWVPLFVDAKFDNTSPNNLNVTLYGNVTGQQFQGALPPPSSPQWDDNSEKLGKIAAVGSAGNYSTLLADFKVLTYDAYNAKGSQFCPHLESGSCPLGPLFDANATDPYSLHSFALGHDFGSPYYFSTLTGTIRVLSGDNNAPEVVCVTTNITPDLGRNIANLITWLPAAILILKGIATLAAAIYSPWGSSDIFRWSSNYGRDEDLLRLVTPGFGDCLQYIQFVTLMGSLTLQFPGFFQPALSQTAWSLLLFNESFVSHGSGTQSLQDGIYVTNGTYGIANMRQLIGMSESEDVWACMAIFLGVIAAAVIVMCQLGFFGRWIYRTATRTSEEDLRQKNLPFTLGNMVRLLLNFFILPIVALSLFQLVITAMSPTVVVALAAVLFVIVIVTAGWIMRVIFAAKPRTFLFDDMTTVLLYGPLYNTYSDSAAPFALVPVLITFIRGVAFGAVQPSGTAQIIILAICEIILILTLNAFRPFQNQTSMNAYHTFFSVVRLITVLLCIAFIPSLAVDEAPKGWIGYVILLLHACVLVFGFFLNSAQTLIEVICRSLGIAGHGAQTGEVRGSILNWRMLKQRRARPITEDRSSMASHAGMLAVDAREDGRSRSMSTSSQQLLNQGTPSTHRLSGNLSNGGEPIRNASVDLNKAQGGIAYVAVPNSAQEKPGLGVKTDGETFYRPPRRRTIDALTPGAQSRSVVDPDVPYQDSPPRGSGGARDSEGTVIAPAFFRERADSGGEGGPRPDYAVREVDQYYRGEALSGQPSRKLKTGPADPQGPAATAQTWLQRLAAGLGGKKTKEAGKGFEVVRSSRMPPGTQQKAAEGEDLEMETSPPMNDEPYRDSPEMQPGKIQAAGGAERSVSPEDDERPPPQAFNFGFDGPKESTRYDPRQDSAMGTRSPAVHPGMRAELPARDRSLDVQSRTRPSQEYQETNRYTAGSSEYADDRPARISEVPSLAPIETVGGIDIPSRFNTHKSRSGQSANDGDSQAQDWLHAVDNLSWTHNSSAAPSSSSSRRDREYRQRTPAPTVPPRSHRRTSSDGQVPRSDPRMRSQSPDRRGEENEFEGFDSRTGFYMVADDEEEGRPNSLFNTSHHRAADSIHRNSFGANAAMQASSAEFMGASPPDQSGFGTGRRR